MGPVKRSVGEAWRGKRNIIVVGNFESSTTHHVYTRSRHELVPKPSQMGALTGGKQTTAPVHTYPNASKRVDRITLLSLNALRSRDPGHLNSSFRGRECLAAATFGACPFLHLLFRTDKAVFVAYVGRKDIRIESEGVGNGGYLAVTYC